MLGSRNIELIDKNTQVFNDNFDEIFNSVDNLWERMYKTESKVAKLNARILALEVKGKEK